VCVRIVDMRDVDLNLIRFDFDLTMAIVLMHPDGTIYHRYGSRGAGDPTGWMSVPSLARLLRDTLAEHRAHRPKATDEALAALLPIDLPPLRRKIDAGQDVDCVHCHTIHDMEHALAVEEGRWRDGDQWIHPDPAQVGVQLDADDQSLLRAVTADSAAARAGLQAGDRLLRLGAQPRVRTMADAQWALHLAAPGDTGIELTFARDGRERAATLQLEAGWKARSPEAYAWRPYKWNLSPAPGFGGPALNADEKRALGLEPAQFAFRVQYLVNWGENAHRGRAAAKAGIRTGDVVLSFAGKHDFVSIDHFHAWVPLTRRAGEEVEVVLLRGGEKRTVRYALPE
jgi:predicted metalloprotease with PDZ domain